MGIAQLILDQMSTAGKPKTSTSTTTSTGSQTQTQNEPMDLQSLGMLLALFLGNKFKPQGVDPNLGSSAGLGGNFSFGTPANPASNFSLGGQPPSNPLAGLMNQNNQPAPQQDEIAQLFKSLLG